MRKRALAVVLSICILLSVPAALCGLAFGLPAQHDQTYLAALQDKPDRIQSALARALCRSVAAVRRLTCARIFWNKSCPGILA